MNKKEGVIKYRGVLNLAGKKIPCYVLEDGRRVLSERGMQGALKIEVYEDKPERGGQLRKFLAQKSLQPFIYKEKKAADIEPIICHLGKMKINGFEAPVLVDICDGVLEARNHIELDVGQERVANEAEIIVRSVAKVGIIALVDEATGYQYERERFELQRILRLFVLKDKLFSEWKKTFPLSFYKELFGVYGIPFTAEKIRRKPLFIGYLTNELVYKNLPEGSFVLKEIKERTPKTKGGYYRKSFHQSLTKIGKKALSEIINIVETLAWVSKGDRNKFLRLVKERFHPNRDLPYIDVEAMEDSEPKTKFDKVLEAISKVPKIKKEDE